MATYFSGLEPTGTPRLEPTRQGRGRRRSAGRRNPRRLMHSKGQVTSLTRFRVLLPSVRAFGSELQSNITDSSIFSIELIKRTTRLRTEFLFRKSLEGKERTLYDRKRKIRLALEEGKPIPTELRNEEVVLREEIDLELGTHNIDDEYANAAESDPKILLTTSRDPSSRLTQFVKELKIVFPNSQRINRGGQVISDIVESCKNNDFTDILLVHEHRGEPDGLIVCHLPFGPTAYFGLLNVLGKRIAKILKFLFPEPKVETKRIITFANQADCVSFRHHVYEKPAGVKSMELREVGPRFELRLYQIKLGTMDQVEAQNEWVVRPYMISSRKCTAV